MRMRVFTLSFDSVERRFDDAELNAFLAGRDVVSVAEHLFVHEQQPTWAFMVTWREAKGARPSPRREQTDWRAELGEVDGALYEALREWRKDRAQQEGKPVYALFNNRQLAEIARVRPGTAAALGAISGVGSKRVETYGAMILAVVQGAA